MKSPRLSVLLPSVAALVLLAGAGCSTRALLPTYCDEDVRTATEGAPESEEAVGAYEKVITGGKGVPLKTTYWFPTDEEGDGLLCYDNLYPSSAVLGATAACDDGPRPVIVYSHGNGGTRYASAELTEYLASQGYLVIAPDHTFNTAFDADRTAEGFLDVIERRPFDIRLAFDAAVAEAHDPLSPLYGCIDEAAGYGVMGHSFGGYTALAVGGAEVRSRRGGPSHVGDSRAWAVFAMAPWDAVNTIVFGVKDIDVPLLVLVGELDELTPFNEVSRLVAPATAHPHYFGMMPGAGHYTFAPPACLIVDGDGCGEGFVDLNVATGVVASVALRFFAEARGLDVAPPTTLEVAAAVVDWDPEQPWL